MATSTNRGSNAVFPQPHSVAFGDPDRPTGLTIREYFTLEIYKVILQQNAVEDSIKRARAVEKADKLIAYLQDRHPTT